MKTTTTKTTRKSKAMKRPRESGGLKVVEELRVDIGEASALVPLGKRRFLVADDEAGIRLVDQKSTVLISADDDERVAGLEGMCLVVGRNGGRVLAVREHDGAVVSFPVPSSTGKRAPVLEEMGALPRPPASPGKKNKGWEGLAHLPAKVAFDAKDHIVAVHEGKPRSVSLFSWPGLEPELHHEIGGALDALLPDLSDVAVHPKTGELWILSDEGETVARVSLSKSGLTLVQSHAIPVEDGEKPEGIAFDEDGAMWIVTDDSGRLLRLE